MTESLIGYAVFGWAPFGCLLVGLLHVLLASCEQSAVRRLLAAAYAPLAALLYLSIALTPLRELLHEKEAFFAVQAVPPACMVLGAYLFRGPRRAVHGLLLAIAVVCMVWQFAWTYAGLYGK